MAESNPSSPPFPGGPDPARRLARAEQLLETLRRALAHDLPNQLVAIQGLAHILDLEEGDRLGADGRDYLKRLTAATQRAHHAVRNLAELIKLELGGEAAQAVALADVARAAAAEVNQLFPGRQIEYHFPQVLPDLALPRLALRQVLSHLFRNAVQAVEVDRRPCIKLGVCSVAAGQEVWVADNGRGIPEEQRRQFEAFFSGQAASPGDGFGLLLVRQVAASWGATLHVRPGPDGGTVFSLRVPAP